MKNILNLNLNGLEFENSNTDSTIKKVSKKDIAIIGLSFKMPLAEDSDPFWNNMRNCIDCVRKIPKSRQKDVDAYLQYMNVKNDDLIYKEAAYIDDIDKFDYTFFGMSPNEAKLTDPNQRLFLETAWAAIEDAGYGGNKLIGSRTGVYIGSEGESEYKRMITDIEPSSLSIALPGNISAIIASRISYLLDLRGPSMVVDTSCSSSLVAVHVACQSIRNGECDVALAGGIRIYILPFRKTQIGVESSSGRTKSFDNSSDGLGAGEGVVAILLKPLDKAIEDKDIIYAVIKGSAINQDGNSIGITAPNIAAQEDVILRALKDAGVHPEEVSFIEAHGSGTKLGDPVEVNGITRAFKRFTGKKQFCAIGSVKANIGHLDTAAGITGLLKATLAIKFRELPANLHFNRPNNEISFENSPVYINDELITWDEKGKKITCGVSSFGISGTNCHIILQAPPEVEVIKMSDQSERLVEILAISAKSLEALKQLIKRYKEFTEKKPDLDLSDLCYTANTGRGAFHHRIVFVLKDYKDLTNKLKELNSNWDEALKLDGIYYATCEVDSYKKVSGGCEISRYSGNISQSDLNKEFRLSELLKNLRSYEEVLKKLGEYFINGTYIDWTMIYKEGNHQKINIPTYPFERKRCWLEIPEQWQDIKQGFQEPYFVLSWESSNIKKSNENRNGYTLVLSGNSEKVIRIISEMKEQGKAIIEVFLGNNYEKVDDNTYIINGLESDYQRLLNDIKAQKKKLVQIIHAFTLDNESEISILEDLQEKQELGVYSLFRLIKALNNSGIREQLDIVLIAGYVNNVSKDQHTIRPENALLFGLGKVIGWESPHLRVRCIDIDENTDLKEIIKELNANEGNYKVAYRNGCRYIEVLKKVNLSDLNTKSINIKENGVYIITGGTGKIGLIIAKHIALKNKVRLILINRSEMPKKEQWNQIVESNESKGLAKKIKQIQAIESIGSIVECYGTDITNEKALRNTFNEIRRKYGQINGVIHSAGVGIGMEGITIDNEEEDVFKSVMAPKVEGTWILNKVINEDKLDFFILFSSAITLIGGVGGGDYIAANSYLESFAEFKNNEGANTLTISWPVWKEEPSFVGVKHLEEKQVFKMIDPDQAMEAFDMVYNIDLTNVIIGELNYSSEVFELGDYLPFKFSEQLKLQISQANYQQNLKSKKSNMKDHTILLKGREGQEYSKIESLVAQIWHKVLGYDEFNINDNFFEIGGDSIRIIKVYSLMEENFPGKVNLTDLFAYPTISKISRAICSMEPEENRKNISKDINIEKGILELLKEIKTGKITIEDAVQNYYLMR